ncbi:uncharacterized protein TM35_000241210 [Trypanosoma theileri]|uniref:Uncharacterized protein n=1 Tax=Trypanosoma theileri TaxID=67003 RepID=A0A1X0NQU8_9TRYP|nr:uncharacterized protein TM35_000241210 [Trypanosoma theileri]ORC86971.1 hypothetical protein TM35_000241210 [Trypanosoma theileri]
MLTTHSSQVGAMYTISHEVVNRVALERYEDSQTAFHVAKRDYQLTMNRISSRLPATVPELTMEVKDEFSTYCSSNAESMNATRRIPDDGLDCSEIDKILSERAMKRFEEDTTGGPTWKRSAQPKKPLELLMHRESLARQDIEDVEHEFFRNLTQPFFENPLMHFLKLTRDERRERKTIEDTWMSESLPFLDHCHMKQVDYEEEFLRRALGKVKRPLISMRSNTPQTTSDELDVRLYQPLLQRCETIRRETESEEEIAFLYLRLGEASQRDLVARGIMRRNKNTGLLDSVRHPIEVDHYYDVDLAFGTEFRYLESREETERMAIIDSWLLERCELCKTMGILS